MSRKDRALGLVLGLAAGDKNKGPCHMAFALLRSLATVGSYKAEAAFAEYFRWYMAKGPGWHDTGPTAAAVFKAVSAKIRETGKDTLEIEKIFSISREFDQKSGGQTAGANAVHRCAAIALLNASDDQLAKFARDDSKLTHFSKISQDSCASFVVLCRNLVEGESLSESLHKARHAKGMLPVVAERFDENFFRDPSKLNSGGFCLDVVSTALYFVRNCDNFGDTLCKSIEFAGAANYCPVLVGAVAGAIYGAGAVPNCELMHVDLETIREMRQLVDKLLK